MIAIHPETGLKICVFVRERKAEGRTADGTPYSVVTERWHETDMGQPVEIDAHDSNICYIHTDTSRVQCIMTR